MIIPGTSDTEPRTRERDQKQGTRDKESETRTIDQVEGTRTRDQFQGFGNKNNGQSRLLDQVLENRAKGLEKKGKDQREQVQGTWDRGQRTGIMDKG